MSPGGLTEVDGLASVGDDARLGLEKVHWSVEREVAMRNDGLSVTSRIVVSAPDSRFENSPLPRSPFSILSPSTNSSHYSPPPSTTASPPVPTPGARP